jgi:hypothetical protein
MDAELLFVIGAVMFLGSISVYCFTEGVKQYRARAIVRRRINEMVEAIHKCQY